MSGQRRLFREALAALRSSLMHWNPLADEQPTLGDVVIAIGVFDGMHLGHRALFAIHEKAYFVIF